MKFQILFYRNNKKIFQNIAAENFTQSAKRIC